MAQTYILVVDDEEDIRSILDYNLIKEGYEVTCVSSGEEALKAARDRQPELMILDLMLPGINGLDVCRRLKRDPGTEDIRIIMLSARGTEADIVTGLELGADDYVTKPFSPRELIARVRSVLRRSQRSGEPDSAVLSRDTIKVHVERRDVHVDSTPVSLTATEFGILHLLIKHPGWVWTRDQIIEHVRGDNYSVTDRSVDVHITSLRKKLGSAGQLIETVHGVGYRFKE